MDAKGWLTKHNVNLNNYHGNIGDYEGNICIETPDGWIFWNKEGQFEKIN